MSNSSHYKDYFLSHRHITNELIGKIDKEHYEYQPTPTSMPAQKLVTHMLTSFYGLASAAAKQAPKQIDNQDVALSKLAELYTDETVKLIESLTDEALEETIDLSDTMGMKVPAGKLLEVAIDHEINHKGNLFVYVREMGYTDLPMFVKK
ncbi:DinB family protein [Salipaludibacillus sp. HK11]|uniref:DinB family protein n=1 Tax=Salipaludibacillus sp. HK11 TaxID=3394320 RepID=UPI0039FD18BE